MSNWTLFSNHGHVLFCLARNPEARLRDVAADVGITERAVQKIVRDLQDGGMISVTKIGRRNCYRIHKKQPLRHSLEADCKIRDLIKVIVRAEKPADSPAIPIKKAEHAVCDETEPLKRSDDLVAEPDKKIPIKEPGVSKPEPVKSKSKEKDETESPGHSDSIEKQQGSLF
jgi:predicted transcriptional regulator